ncbi:flavodoxin domain-containing protein [Mameliella alba]|uniref:flavodoxin domain-containing protein n=1 Tax=Mameliella alba TaxID=561184 RepID=UPI000B52A5C4|nr:flavodoxin domain-containing protein [Mameliella alba]MBY6122408.1 protoporphyrinogen oxidase [Mameliella alba]OWV39628.1 protoporphyrinogen oxidase [Mameliella alba]OWV53377.1 protoporphyrinogen oxidase [Mameliella alba]
MKMLIAYASTEGQTRRIARFLMDRLADQGHSVELVPVTEAADIDLARFDRVILAASVHLGHYQKDMGEFAARHGAALDQLPVLFVSVSLAAAGHDAEEWADLDRIVSDFAQATDWHPKKVVQVAGAYRPSEYDIFRRFVMRRIVAAKDPQADPDKDHEYTDWQALGAALDDWLSAKG